MSGRRRSAAALGLGVLVLLAGALLGLCLSTPEGPVTERSAIAVGVTPVDGRAGATPLRVEDGRSRAAAAASRDEGARRGPEDRAALAAPTHGAPSGTGEGRDVCCGAGHDEGDEQSAAPAGVLLGRVLDPAGAPLAAARVEARTIEGATIGVGQSGPDGCFRLEVAAAGELVVVPRCTGWLDGRSLPVRLRQGDAAHVGDLRLSEGLTLAGRVVDSAGRTVEGARVALVDGEGERHVVSEVDGAFEVTGLAAGEATLVASAPGALPSDPVRCAAGAGGLELRLRGAPRLRGRVLGPDGPIAGARVARLSDLDAAVTTDADGAFELAGERDGEPLLVTAPGLAAARVDADTEVRLAAVTPSPGATPRLVLRRGDAPAAGVTLLVAPAGAGDLDGAEARVEVVTSDAAGLVWLGPGAFDLALVDATTAHARLETRSLSPAEAATTWELPPTR